MNISFAWTTAALLAGKKTVTRRTWDDDYAKRFRAGMIVYATTCSRGGKKIAEIRITKDPYQEWLKDLTEEHFQREGGTLHWKNREEFISMFPAIRAWVIEFEIVKFLARKEDGKVESIKQKKLF